MRNIKQTKLPKACFPVSDEPRIERMSMCLRKPNYVYHSATYLYIFDVLHFTLSIKQIIPAILLLIIVPLQKLTVNKTSNCGMALADFLLELY